MAYFSNGDTEEFERDLIITVAKFPNCFEEVAEIVQAHDFEAEIYKDLFNIAEGLSAEGQLSLHKLIFQAKQKGVLSKAGDPQFFTQLLLSSPVSAELANDYAERVLDSSLRRAAAAAANEIFELAQTDEFSIERVIDIAQSLEGKTAKQQESFQDYLLEYYEKKVSGVVENTPTLGFPKTDSWMKGIGRNRLIVVAGRPGTGKTAFALHILRHIASRKVFGVPMIFSLEMEKAELLDRMVASSAGINSLNLTRNELTDEERERILDPIDKIRNLKMIIDDNPTVTVNYIKRKALAAKKKHGQLACIIIDYLGLMNMQRRNNESQAEAIERTTRDLKLFAKKIGCSIILLAQLNRENEKTNRRPKSSDLRGSGSIEQDADMIFLLYHDEDRDPDKYTNRIELIIDKGRQTGTNLFYIDFIKPIQRMIEVV